MFSRRHSWCPAATSICRTPSLGPGALHLAWTGSRPEPQARQACRLPRTRPQSPATRLRTKIQQVCWNATVPRMRIVRFPWEAEKKEQKPTRNRLHATRTTRRRFLEPRAEPFAPRRAPAGGIAFEETARLYVIWRWLGVTRKLIKSYADSSQNLRPAPAASGTQRHNQRGRTDPARDPSDPFAQYERLGSYSHAFSRPRRPPGFKTRCAGWPLQLVPLQDRYTQRIHLT